MHVKKEYSHLSIMKHVAKTFFLVLIGHLLSFSGCNEPPIDVPLISSFTPLTGELQTIITIQGNNFAPSLADNLVNINGFTCPIISGSSTELVIKAIPGVSSGTVSVTVDHLSAIAFEQFTLISHQLDSINPKEGSIGDKIVFFGTKFTLPADNFDPQKDVKVRFNDKDAGPISDYATSQDTTTFSVPVPVGATTGKIYVTIGSVTVEYKDEFEVIP